MFKDVIFIEFSSEFNCTDNYSWPYKNSLLRLRITLERKWEVQGLAAGGV